MWPVITPVTSLIFALSKSKRSFVRRSFGLWTKIFEWLHVEVDTQFCIVLSLSHSLLYDLIRSTSSGRKGSGPSTVLFAPRLARLSATALPDMDECAGTQSRFSCLCAAMPSRRRVHSFTSLDEILASFKCSNGSSAVRADPYWIVIVEICGHL